MESEKRQEVLELIEKRKDSIISFLQRLISIPSVTGEEWEIQKLLTDKIREMGLEVDLWEPDHEELKKHPAYVAVDRGYEKRPNLVGICRGEGGGKSLLFNGHVDVIPPGPPDAWSFDPFSAEIQDRPI
jgi:acetylornithine deacetylase